MEEETQTQTQPQAKQLMTDIFGDSDEEDNNVPQQKAAAPPADSDDDLFAGSDDDNRKTDRAESSSKLSGRPLLADDNLLDSDDEEVRPKKGAVRRKRPKGPAEKVKGGRLKKRKTAPSSSRHGGDDNSGNSGNEYDSGEEVRETKDDRNFIDNDDEFADIVKEYEEDNQDFNDEGPDDDYRSSKSNKKKRGSADPQAHHSSGINLKDQDPLSQTLAAMKNPKAKVLSDAEKDRLVDKLLTQMAKAVKLDDEQYAKQQPAVNKMALLEMVQTTVSMKPLHQTLLDKDILSYLRDWIEPRDAHTLPALSVRTTIYDLLMQLPCLPDHLKRSNNEKPPIGVIIVALRKHKMETTANKRILKELMDKWSRPIFSKSADIRGGGVASLPATEHPEVQEAILQRYAHQAALKNAAAARSVGAGASSREDDEAGERTSSSSSSAAGAGGASRSVGFGALISGQADGHGAGGEGAVKKAPDLYSRARTPYNQGFLFTVQPELKNIDKRNVMERTLGEGRMKLFKKMSEGGGGGGKGLGKKANPR